MNFQRPLEGFGMALSLKTMSRLQEWVCMEMGAVHITLFVQLSIWMGM
jgi:hypothetical protein